MVRNYVRRDVEIMSARVSESLTNKLPELVYKLVYLMIARMLVGPTVNSRMDKYLVKLGKSRLL